MRLSYTDYTRDQGALDNLIYDVEPYENTTDAESASALRGQKLIDKSPIIVECTAQQRSVSYRSFKTKVHVDKVLKGDPSLEGTDVSVFEPVELDARAININIYGTSDKALAKAMGVNDGDMVHVLEPSDGYSDGVIMMREGGRYVLCLKGCLYPTGYHEKYRPGEYQLVNSSYAKLSLNGPTNALIAPKDPISLSTSLNYELIAKSKKDFEKYLAEKDKVLKLLRVSPES